MPSPTDRIEKQVVLAAPRARVWRAISDVREFNEWFGVRLTSPFAPGAAVSGNMAFPGYEHVTMTVWVETVVPERLLAFRWHPGAVDTSVDYSAEPTTLVTFTLEDVDEGTRLTVVESGFDAIPEARRGKAFAGNARGWDMQAERVRAYVETGSPVPAGAA